MSGDATRLDGGKPRTDLLPPGPLLELAKLYGWGCGKYGAHNWRKGMAWSRCIGSCLRHIFAWMRGEDNDEESGLNHLVHAAWNLITLIEYTTLHPDLDDRFTTTGQVEPPEPEDGPPHLLNAAVGMVIPVQWGADLVQQLANAVGITGVAGSKAWTQDIDELHVSIEDEWLRRWLFKQVDVSTFRLAARPEVHL